MNQPAGHVKNPHPNSQATNNTIKRIVKMLMDQSLAKLPDPLFHEGVREVPLFL
jgi:hypothetical protein